MAPALPNEVSWIIDRALQAAKSERYPSAKDMRRDVRAVLKGKPPPFATSALTP